MYDGDLGPLALRRAASNPGARWPSPTTPGEETRMTPEAWPILKPRFQLSRADTVFTIGSCFARNIERYLDQYGLDVPMLKFSLPAEEMVEARPQAVMNKYTPPSIYQELKRTADLWDMTPEERKPHFAALMLEVTGGFIDLELGGRHPVPIERALERREDVFQTFRHAFTADVVVITLGLIECWWDTERNSYVHPVPPTREVTRAKGRYLFKQLRYHEAYDFIRKSVELLKSRGKDGVRILLTTSPVPINTTFTDADVIMANMYSKCMLRTVAGEIYRDFETVDYFPSFENVMLTRTDSVWHQDLVHVSDAFVGKIVENLLKNYLPDTSDDNEVIARAVALLKMRDYTKAAAALSGITIVNARVKALRALAELEQGDASALAELKRLAPIADLKGNEYNLFVRKLVVGGARADAAKVLQRALDAGVVGQTEKINALLQLARLLRGLKNDAGVRAALAEATRLAPQRTSVLRHLAADAAITGDARTAVEYLDRIIASPQFRNLNRNVKIRTKNMRKVQAEKLGEPAPKESASL